MANRLLLGQFNGGDYRLRISQPGYNVNSTGLTPEQLTFDSTFPAIGQVTLSGTTSFPTVSGTYLTSREITFGTTYPAIPLVFAVTRDPDRGYIFLNSNCDTTWVYGSSLGNANVKVSETEMTIGSVHYYYRPINGFAIQYWILRNLDE